MHARKAGARDRNECRACGLKKHRKNECRITGFCPRYHRFASMRHNDAKCQSHGERWYVVEAGGGVSIGQSGVIPWEPPEVPDDASDLSLIHI